MKFLILLIALFPSLLFSKILTFTQQELNSIEKLSNKEVILNRYNALNKLLEETKKKPLSQKLIDVNLFFNQSLPMLDTNKYNSDDYWSTPKEFLINGEGDCEDYVISKYFTLSKLGIPKKDLYFAVVQLEKRDDYHMVLLYRDKKTKEFLVLDNLSFKILPLEKRVDLSTIAAFNEFETKKLKGNKLAETVSINWGETDKWEDLLHRIYSKKK